jgi:hypothetical protein
LSLLIAFSAVSCNESNKTENSVSDSSVTEMPVTEKVSDDALRGSSFSESEDFFAKLDDDSKNQVNLITDKLPELLEEHSYIFLTDLDGNGRSELVLSDPGFVIYEVSEDRKSLVRTASIDSDCPSLYPVTDKLMCTDESGKRHYVWRSVKEEGQNTIRESEKEYIYENGALSSRTLRSRLYEKYRSVYTDYFNEKNEPGYGGYARAVSGLLFGNGNSLKQCSIGILTAGDIEGTDKETLKQLLSELKGFFRITEPKEQYQFTDLEGKWIRTGGFSAGDDYFQTGDTGSVSLNISSETYQLTGSVQSDVSPLSFCLGGTTTTLLWYADLGENNVIKNASLSYNSNGTLNLEGTAVNSDGKSVNIEWIFAKEGSQAASDFRQQAEEKESEDQYYEEQPSYVPTAEEQYYEAPSAEPSSNVQADMAEQNEAVPSAEPSDDVKAPASEQPAGDQLSVSPPDVLQESW